MNDKITMITKLFEGKEIRSVWNSEVEDYFFSVVDVIAALTDANIPRNYWSDLKRRLIEEGSEVNEKIVQLKLKAKDGKTREFYEEATGLNAITKNRSLNYSYTDKIE